MRLFRNLWLVLLFPLTSLGVVQWNGIACTSVNGIGSTASWNGVGATCAAGIPTLVSTTNWTYSGNSSPQTVAFSVSGSGQFLVLKVGNYAGTYTSATYNGDSLTTITNASNSDLPGLKCVLAALVNPDDGNNTLSITIGGAPSDWAFSLELWNNVNQSTPYDGLNVNQAINAASPTALTVTSASGDVVTTAVSIYQSTPTASAPQTQSAQITTSTVELGAAWTNSTGTSISTPYTYTGNRWWIQPGINLNP